MCDLVRFEAQLLVATMNGPKNPPAPSEPSIRANDKESSPSGPGHFYEPIDWLTFSLTTILTLAIYLFTLAPEVTLSMSGALATASNYGGVAHPPGFPLWTMYTWCFTKLLPFSNIAWRVAVSSAVA